MNEGLVRRTILLLGTMLAALVVAGGVAFAVGNCNWRGWCYCKEGVRCDGTSGSDGIFGSPDMPRSMHTERRTGCTEITQRKAAMI